MLDTGTLIAAPVILMAFHIMHRFLTFSVYSTADYSAIIGDKVYSTKNADIVAKFTKQTYNDYDFYTLYRLRESGELFYLVNGSIRKPSDVEMKNLLIESLPAKEATNLLKEHMGIEIVEAR